MKQHQKKWSAGETNNLRDLWQTHSLDQIAAAIGRSRSACIHRGYQIELSTRDRFHAPPRTSSPWSDEATDVEAFTSLWRSPTTSILAIANHYRTSRHAVQWHAASLHLGPKTDDPQFDAPPAPAPRMRHCCSCDTRQPLHEFDGPNSKTCNECRHPFQHNPFPIPQPADFWEEDAPIGGHPSPKTEDRPR